MCVCVPQPSLSPSGDCWSGEGHSLPETPKQLAFVLQGAGFWDAMASTQPECVCTQRREWRDEKWTGLEGIWEEEKQLHLEPH